MSVHSGREGEIRSGSLALLRDFRLLVYLFVAFRLLLLIVYQPILVGDTERGVSAGGDLVYFYGLGRLADRGLLPFRDYWSEFPPVWPAIYVFVAQITESGGQPNYTAFASVMGLIMLAFDTGNLILLRRIGERLHGRDTGLALAWIYAVLLAPAVFLWWTFEAMVAFWLLLGLWELVRERDGRSALAAAVGGLTKFVPLILLGAAWRFRELRAALRYTGIALGVFALVYLGLIAATGEMGAVSLVAQFGKSSYSTVWALIDGNYATGIFGPVASRLDPAAATVPVGNPAVIPSGLRLIVFGGIGLFAFWRTRRHDAQGVVAFTLLTLLIFFLWAQGWSPQWLVLLIPLILLCFPERGGVLIVLLLSLIVFAEYPLLFIRTGDTGGVIAGPLRTPFVVLVLARTAILAGLAFVLYRRLRAPAVEDH